MFQLATSYLTPTGAMSCFSFLKQSCRKTHPAVVEKMSVIFRRVKSLACIKQRKHLRRLQKLPKLGKNCPLIIKNWKDSGDPSSLRKKCGRKKILNDRDRRSLKRLVKSNNPIENIWDVLEKALRSRQTLPSSIQDLGEKLIQHWVEINLVILQKLIETMPQLNACRNQS
ncbi:hypothetical protein ATANTOWER_001394 [Ataeniobius toweri]|uniref:Transposase n=1 Tax=Ataeniobius toweri TaxID=208326 RepID=A0ABU7C4Z9_9TELE|nr:hypothetical protein [Ataeniobius toweri]